MEPPPAHVMVTSPDPARQPQRSQGQSPASRELVPWLGLAQLLIGTALLVLFAVMLNRTKEQSRQLERLELRLQNLENVRALERTSALEAQLRKMLARLQVIEGEQRQWIDQIEALQAEAEQRQQARRDAAPLVLPMEPGAAERPSARGGQRPERVVEPQSSGMPRQGADPSP